ADGGGGLGDGDGAGVGGGRVAGLQEDGEGGGGGLLDGGGVDGGLAGGGLRGRHCLAGEVRVVVVEVATQRQAPASVGHRLCVRCERCRRHGEVDARARSGDRSGAESAIRLRDHATG